MAGGLSVGSVVLGRLRWVVVLVGLLLWMGVAGAQEVRLVVGLTDDKDTLDVADLGTAANDFGLIVFDRLITFDADGEFVPELATDWSVSDDGLTWTFNLRQGHRFHDGTAVNAQAVKDSFDRLMDPDLGFLRRAVFDVITNIEVVGEYAIAFSSDEVHPFMLNTLADVAASIVSPTAAAELGPEGFAVNPVGSGPYRFREWERGSRIVFEKNYDHWLAPDSNVDVIEFRIVPDISSRAIGLETGELDFVMRTDPIDAARLDALPNITAYNLPLVRNLVIAPNMLVEPFDDQRVRHAISHAIDRQLMIDVFLQGFARASDSAFTPGVWSYAPQEPFEFDPDLARALLAEAGYPNGFSTKLRVPTGRIGGIMETAEAVVQMLGDVGIRVELDLVEHAAWIVTLRAPPEEATHEMTFWTWGTLTGEPDYAVRLQFHTDNWSPTCCNRNFYSNPEVDELIMAGLSAIDEEERRGIYERIQEIVWEEQAHIFLYDLNHTSVGNTRVSGIGVLPTERWDFRAVTKR